MVKFSSPARSWAKIFAKSGIYVIMLTSAAVPVTAELVEAVHRLLKHK